jgi:hypothetical protein
MSCCGRDSISSATALRLSRAHESARELDNITAWWVTLTFAQKFKVANVERLVADTQKVRVLVAPSSVPVVLADVSHACRALQSSRAATCWSRSATQTPPMNSARKSSLPAKAMRIITAIVSGVRSSLRRTVPSRTQAGGTQR